MSKTMPNNETQAPPPQLLPCPWCGIRPQTDPTWGEGQFVECVTENCSYSSWSHSPMPVEQWNTRRENAAATDEVTRMREALEEILKFEGAFNRDPLKHAENVIANIEQIAKAALASSAAEEEG